MARAGVVLVVVLVALGVVVSAVSCGSAACGPSNCYGCCSAGVCLSGTTREECGSSGGSCDYCSSAQSCVAGVCRLGGGGGGGAGGGGGGACTAANCAGCCLNGACQPGNTASACGKSAVACVACQTNQICRTDQSCGADPNSVWKVQPASATISPNNNGAAWDGDNSAPDVVVSLDCAPMGTAWDSSTAEVSSYTPIWSTGGCSGKASDLLASGFDFQLTDIDVVSNDTITAQLHVTLNESHLVAGTVGVSAAGGMQNMTFQLQKQ